MHHAACKEEEIAQKAMLVLLDQAVQQSRILALEPARDRKILGLRRSKAQSRGDGAGTHSGKDAPLLKKVSAGSPSRSEKTAPKG